MFLSCSLFSCSGIARSPQFKANPASYFADDTLCAEASPVLNIRNTSPRAIVAVGSLESDYVASSEDFVNAYRAAGGEARLLVLEGKHHDDTTLSAADADGLLVRDLLALIKSGE